MKTTHQFLVIISICIALFQSCESKKSTTPEDQPKIQETQAVNIENELAAIEATRNQFQLAIKEKRYSDLGLMKTDDMIGVGPASAEWLEYRRQREQPMGMFSYDSIIMSPTETVILNDSMAYDFGTSKVYYTNAEGISVELKDTFLVLLKKEDGKWKMFRELASGIIK